MQSSSSESVSLFLAGLEIPPFGTEHQKSTIVSSDSPTSRLNLSSNRRSVISMKTLIPLTLPSISSSYTNRNASPIAEDGSMGNRVDEYLPELLARDLEASECVFTAKHMTAGCPIIASSEEKAKGKSARMSTYSPYLAASARVQSLGAIEEQESIVSFFDEVQTEPALQEQISESASTSSQCSSEEAAPPSFRHRDSVITKATSFNSMNWKLKNTSPTQEQAGYECSWIDGDSDVEEDDCNSSEEHRNSASPSPRPPTSSSSILASPISAVGPRVDSPNSWAYTMNTTHRKSHSVSGGSPLESFGQRLSNISVDSPARLSTLADPWKQLPLESSAYGQMPTFGKPHNRYQSRPSRSQSLRARTPDNFSTFTRPRRNAIYPELSPEQSPAADGFPDLDDDSLHSTRLEKQTPVLVSPPTPPEQIGSVQSWLTKSLQSQPWACHSDDGSKAVPLPPDAIETLRVLVACFPETMLLTSSLTVETIRSYSKKVRHPPVDLFNGIPNEMSPGSPRKSLWSKVKTYKRGQQQPEPKTPPRYTASRNGNSMDSASSAELEAPKPWIPIKNIFGCCSDYICDALYAHIVAYNYISAVLARSPAPTSSHNRHSGLSIAKDLQQQDDIPKKAASLLGLNGNADRAPSSMGRLSRRLSSPLADWAKESMVTGRSTAPTTQDIAMRAIQVGLSQCISKLIATAKLMVESGTGEERIIDVETDSTDLLLMRSLCEIVRMAEETL